MTYLLLFLAGALLCNAIPHLAAGLRGEPFPTPFARPRRVGLSPPLVNFLWGLLNAVVGLWLTAERPLAIGVNLPSLALLAGAPAIGIYLSLHFAKVRRDREG